MNLVFDIKTLEEMNLATVMGPDEPTLTASLNQFLETSGFHDSHRYTCEMATEQRGVKNVFYLQHATVPLGTKRAGTVMVIPMPKAEYLHFRLNETEYHRFGAGEFKEELESYLKTNGMKQDRSRVFGLAEKSNEGGVTYYDCYLPFRK